VELIQCKLDQTEKISMAMKWLILYSRRRNEKSMAQRLASECLAAAKEEGAAVKKRMDTHKRS
jgi:small subunit ribosomal protein S7